MDPPKRSSRTVQDDYAFFRYKLSHLEIWKRMFVVSYDPVWCSIVIAASCFNVIESLYRSINGACVHRDVAFYIILDVIFMVDIALYLGCFNIPQVTLPEITLARRSKWVVICEIISVIPIQYLIPTTTQLECEIYCVFRLHRVLKIVRIFSFFLTTDRYLVKSLMVVGIQLVFNVFFFITLTQAFYYNCKVIVYRYKMDTYSEIQLIQNITTTVILGGKSGQDRDIIWELSVMIGIIASLYVVNARTAFFVLISANKNARQSNYRHHFLSVNRRLKNYQSSEWLVNWEKKVFNKFWEERSGCEVRTECLRILPPCMENAVKVNMGFAAFQHSKLFRNISWPFLRHISDIVKIRYCFAGEYVFRLNYRKNKMLYLVTGEIQILSDEDGVSPIFCFSAGTCIGESTLFISYKSTTVVRCQTYCVFYILEMKHLQRILGVFKNDQRKLRQAINIRYKRAREIRELWNVDQSRETQRQIRRVPTVWLKNVLHHLMSVDKESTMRHEFQNIYLINEYNQRDYETRVFTASYIDSLVISERLPQSQETYVLKKTFPMLLRPRSPYLYMWEILVIVVAIAMLIGVPYAAFASNEIPSWYMLLKNFATIIFVLDVFIILSTSVPGPNGLYLDFKKNVGARFKTSYFWFAVVAAFPFEIFTPLLIYEINNKTIVAMHLNRLWKIVRIVQNINNMRYNYHVNPVITWFLVWVLTKIYCAYAVYNCFNFYADFEYSQVIVLLKAILFTTGTPKLNVPAHWTFTIAQYVILGLWVWVAAGMCASLILNEKKVQDIQEVASQLEGILKERKLKMTYQRLQDYLTSQYLDTGSFDFSYDTQRNKYISKDIRQAVVTALLRDNPEVRKCFTLFDDDVLSELSAFGNTELFPPNEMITRAGEICQSVYILYKGSCDLYNHKDDFVKYLDKPVEINLLEMILGVPCAHTTVCKTHCSVIKLTENNIKTVLLKRWNPWLEMKSVIANSQEIKQNLQKLGEVTSMGNVVPPSIYFNRSFHVFRNIQVIGSYEEYNYYHYFDKLYTFSFVQHILLRVTFDPQGRFLFIWESVRIFFAIFSCLASFCIPILKSNHKFWLLFLDLTAMVDIYVRCHVAYYDENGLLITHPLSTALHYLTHGFLMDLIGVLPFRYFYEFNVVSEVLFNGTRLFQLHRYIQFINMLKGNPLKVANKLDIIMYLPLMLVLVNLFACTVFTMECSPTPHENHLQPNNVTFIGFQCVKSSVLSSAAYQESVSMFEAHWFLLWVFSTLLTDCPFMGYRLGSSKSFALATVAMVLSTFINMMLFCRIFTYFCKRNNVFMDMKSSVKHLHRWLRETISNEDLIKTVMDTQRLRWNHRNDILIPSFVQPFSSVLRIDVLQECFGKYLVRHTLFKTKCWKFYRNLLEYISVDVIVKNGFLQTINDIDDHLYILIDGIAEVIAPDGTKMDSLGISSMFGNLTSLDVARLKVSVIAITNTQVLRIKTSIWNKMIAYYPSLEEEYITLKRLGFYYISSHPSRNFVERVNRIRTLQNRVDPILMWTTVEGTRLPTIIEKIYLFLPCYFGVLVDVYQLTVLDYSMWVLITQIICDLVFCIQLIMQDRTAYKGRLGFNVKGLSMLRKRNRRNTFFTWIQFVSVWPVDLIAYHIFISSGYLACIIYSIFRLPKLFRIFLFNNYLLKMRAAMMSNLFLYRMIRIVGWMIMIFQCFAYILSFMCYMETNLSVRVPKCREIFDLSSKEKVTLYIQYWFILVTSYGGKLQEFYYPVASATYFIFTLMYVFLSLFFCAVAGRTFSTFYEWYLTNERYYHIYEHLRVFLEKESISLALKHQALNYVEAMWFMWQGEFFPKQVTNATPYLKDAICNNAYSFLLRNHPIFRKCHLDFIRQVVQKLECRMYVSGQFIQFAGSVDCCMYFVYNGHVTVLDDEYSRDDMAVSKLKKGDSFGVLSGLRRHEPHKYSYRCVVRTTILSLCLDHWEYLLEFFPASNKMVYSAAKTYDGF